MTMTMLFRAVLKSNALPRRTIGEARKVRGTLQIQVLNNLTHLPATPTHLARRAYNSVESPGYTSIAKQNFRRRAFYVASSWPGRVGSHDTRRLLVTAPANNSGLNANDTAVIIPMSDAKAEWYEYALVTNDHLELARSTGTPEYEIPTLARLIVWGDFMFGCSVTTRKDEDQVRTVDSETVQLKTLVGPLVDAALYDRPWLHAQVRLEDEIFEWVQSGLDVTTQIQKMEELRRSNFYPDATGASQIFGPGQTIRGDDIGTLACQGFAQTYMDMGLSPLCELYKSRGGKLVETRVSSLDPRGGRHKDYRMAAIFSFSRSPYPF